MVVVATLLEALALVGGAVVVVVGVVADGATSPAMAVALVVLALAFAALLALSARALAEGRRWARSPVATWQLLQGLGAFTAFQQTHAPLALVVVALSLAVLVLLMTPPVVRATTGVVADDRVG